MKIYTKGGDKRRTTLADGKRVGKTHKCIEAVGALDELQAHIGLLAVMTDTDTAKTLAEIQQRLFDIGACAARVKKMPLRPNDADVLVLESHIDRMMPDEGGLTGFILPGGTLAAAQAHVCRTICRRAERRMCALSDVNVPPAVSTYLNRLSDFFFALAVCLNQEKQETKDSTHND